MARAALALAVSWQVQHVRALSVLVDPHHADGRIGLSPCHVGHPEGQMGPLTAEQDWVTSVIPVNSQEGNTTSAEHAPGLRKLEGYQRERGDLEGARLDVIVFGIMRSFQETWPKVEDQLQLPQMESRGARVNVIVSTTLQVRCTEKDYSEGFCSEEWTRWSEDEFKQAIRSTYGPRLRYIYDTSATAVDKVRALLQSDEGSLHTILHDKALRLWSGMNPSHSGITIVLRADVHFDYRTKHVNIASLCDSQPGYNFISGPWERPCFWHQRDWDLGAVACNPRVLQFGITPHSMCDSQWDGCANGSDEPPPLPEGFSGSWKDKCGDESLRACSTYQCNQVLTFMNSGEHLGTLDTYGIFLTIHRYGE
ncbi:unnamed protein product [Prorocentrum cordatum]|uniref:Phospholipase B-like n=1 Tax=Prorocentrum cordatum TaxID=2364126 RepID=A0ABN9Q6K3_9DINO|nr:unnamed protein product [Polarella glacialis]